MVSVRVEARLEGAQEILRRYRELASNPRPLLEAAGSILEASTRRRFETSRGPGGIPWKPSRRAQIQGGGRTLVDKAGLVRSITHRADDRQLEVGIIAKTESAKYAAVHQFGATIRPKKGRYLIFRGADGHMVFAKQVVIPARPFIGVDDQDRTDLLEAWTEQLEELKR